MKLAVIARQSGETLTPVGFVPVDDSALCAGKESLFPQRPDPADLVRIQKDKPVVAGKRWRSICYGDEDIAIEAYKADFEGDSAGTDPGGVDSGDGYDYSYAYPVTDDPETDFRKAAIGKSPAPSAVIVMRTKPRLNGGRINLPIQTALNTFRPRRFKKNQTPFTLIYAGPYLGSAADNQAILDAGFSHIGDQTPNRGLISRDKLSLVMNGGYDQARALAAQLPDSDERKAWLLQWADAGRDPDGTVIHLLMDHQGAANLLGRLVIADFRNDDWSKGQFIPLVTINIETGRINPRSSNDFRTQYYNFLAWVYEGIELESRNPTLTSGVPAMEPPKLLMYDFSHICTYGLSLLSKRQDSSGVYSEVDGQPRSYTPDPTGVPIYFNPLYIGDIFRGGSLAAPLAANNRYALLVKQGKAIAGNQEYTRNVWDDQTFYQKNPDGTFKTQVIKGITCLVPRGDARRTTINGETVDILGAGYYSLGEGDNFLYLQRERIAYPLVDEYFLAGGKHLPWSTDRQAGWEAMEEPVQWERGDGEFKQPSEMMNVDGNGLAINPATGEHYDEKVLNTRPLNPDALEADIIINLLFNRKYKFWMGPQPILLTPGMDLTGTPYAGIGNHSYAAWEIALKAMVRMKTFGWITTQVYRRFFCKIPVLNVHRDRSWYDPKEEHCFFFAIGGGICPSRTDAGYEGKAWWYGFSLYPAMDKGVFTEHLYWFVDEQGNALSKAYKGLIGREIWADEHEIPASCGNVPPSRHYHRLTDMLGNVRVVTGDYTLPELPANTPVPALA